MRLLLANHEVDRVIGFAGVSVLMVPSPTAAQGL